MAVANKSVINAEAYVSTREDPATKRAVHSETVGIRIKPVHFMLVKGARAGKG